MRSFSLRCLKGVGPNREAIFNSLGVYTIRDLLYYFPFRYEDRRNFKKIKDVVIDEPLIIKGKVVLCNLKKMPYFLRSKKVKSVFEIILEDDSGKIKCNWFNQAYLADSIKVDSELIIYGRAKNTSHGFAIVSGDYEFSDKKDSLSVGRIVGVYGLASLLSQKFLRRIVKLALDKHKTDFSDYLPFYIRKEKNIPNIVKSLENIHFPKSFQKAELARKRFIFEELFFSQILVYLRKAKHCLKKGPSFCVRSVLIDNIQRNLSFFLTSGQKKVLSEILTDFKKPFPMHRLLQGDVGCGKTVVAALAIAVCVDSGFQTALMVPTEVLAYQHKETLMKIFERIKVGKHYLDKEIKVITSALTKKEIDNIYQDLKKGKIKIIIGTHSLIQERIVFKKLGLVIVDEQHKFGVAQRALLLKEGKFFPHCLVMSATPIPRSLALSLYGDLDISVIKEFPLGRKLAKTIVIESKERKIIYDFLREKLIQGRQAYIIYSVIEESQNQDLKSLKLMYNKLSKHFSDFSVRMFHGKMKNEEKIKIIKDFQKNDIDILLSTTVVEVGIDIKNATVMIIENPERFGLAQLHQLRGRIQRSELDSYFVLMNPKDISESSKKRIEVISKEQSGFKIAEEDLLLRGPGDFFGSLQHGLPDLKIANPHRDLDLLKQARVCAYKVIKEDPNLTKFQNRCVKERIDADLA